MSGGGLFLRGDKDLSLERYDDLCEALRLLIGSKYDGPELKSLFCPVCAQRVRVRLQLLFMPTEMIGGPPEFTDFPASEEIEKEQIAQFMSWERFCFSPKLLGASCLQCRTHFTLLVYSGSSGRSIAVFPNQKGGMQTPRTPATVAYYLDQAYKCRSVGAYSAAAAMYRAALDQLLLEHGCVQRMCGQKLAELEQKLQAGDPVVKWASELDPEFMKALKELGDIAIHPTKGSKPDAMYDEKIMMEAELVFQEVLFLAYEKDAVRNERLQALKAVTTSSKAVPLLKP